MRLALIFVFVLATLTSFGQETKSNAKTIEAGQATDSITNDDFYLSLDAKKENLLIPATNNNLKLKGIKIFSEDGKELISKRINDNSKTTAINISKLASGNYIVHAVTVEQVIYKTTFVLKR